MTATLHETMSTATTALMYWRRTFPGRPDQARLVRRFVAFLLDDCRHADDAVQVVAELAGNALIHTRSGRPGGTFVVEVRRWEDGLAVSVTDQGGSLEDSGPHRRPQDDDLAENGRGLPIVADLATRVTWTGDPDHGHTVTATFT
ncbi:hypothetical protein GCM10023196_034900 [Actinoallomurus vinaceus]|uniref:Histidine kinase/HSP90-like ATPase domain-containing protein n=1 Tax=Actinoallomurus vinaceus TaxID=1080074 RepID=A0ABP8U8M8_9ACTN